jgi:hypothetical protein
MRLFKVLLSSWFFNPDFPLGASSTLFERWRRIFGHFFRFSLQIASYFRLIHVKTASKSASTIASNPNGNSGFNVLDTLFLDILFHPKFSCPAPT